MTDRFNVTTYVANKVVGPFRRPIPDPFAYTRVTIGLPALLRAIFRFRKLEVVVSIDGDREAVEAVMRAIMEGDPDYSKGIAAGERLAWADYFERYGQMNPPAGILLPKFTPALVAQMMRGPRPFGAAAAEGVKGQ